RWPSWPARRTASRARAARTRCSCPSWRSISSPGTRSSPQRSPSSPRPGRSTTRAARRCSWTSSRAPSISIPRRWRRPSPHGGAKQYHHDEVGTNSRLDSLQAAVLLAKLPHLASWSAKRREHAAYYARALADLPAVRPPAVDPANEHIFHQYTLRVERRDELQAHLKRQGVGSAIYYPVPLHLQPCFSHLGYRPGRLPESERASREVLSLPVYPELAREQLD